jgi:hypothetical protein
MELKEVDFDGVDWIELAQDRVQWRYFVTAINSLRFH